MILSDKQILELLQNQQLLDPYVDHSVKVKYKDLNHETRFNEEDEEKIISYGLSSMGYDLRAADEWQVFRLPSKDKPTIDPKDFKPELTHKISGQGYCIIPPNSLALTRSLEYIRMPDDVLGVCLGKSTYARCGLIVNITPAEPGWHGHLTIEISNTEPSRKFYTPSLSIHPSLS